MQISKCSIKILITFATFHICQLLVGLFGNIFSSVLQYIIGQMSTTSNAQVKSLDHIVLTVANIERTKEYYTRVLGMKHKSFSSPKDPSVVRHALLFGDQKINLHELGSEFEPKAQNVRPGSADLCFLTDTSVDDVLKGLKDAQVNVLEGGKVVDRRGARGNLRSVYVRDPDGNLIE